MIEPIRLELPYPISANRYWRTFPYIPKGEKKPRAVTVPSEEAKKYKADVRWLAKRQGCNEPLIGPVEYTLQLYPKLPLDWAKRARLDPVWWDMTVQCIDLDNARKVLLDALQGIAFTDDSRIRRDPGEIMVPDGEARCVITIKHYAREHPQVGLFEDKAA